MQLDWTQTYFQGCDDVSQDCIAMNRDEARENERKRVLSAGMAVFSLFVAGIFIWYQVAPLLKLQPASDTGMFRLLSVFYFMFGFWNLISYRRHSKMSMTK